MLRGMLAGLLTSLAVAGCSGANGDAKDGATMVFVCTETGKVITAPPGETPALNPDTGRKTLMPGLYCAQCRKWYPSAPLEVAQRNPASRLCPKHRTPMETKGPEGAP